MIRALNDDKETIDIMAAGTAMRFLTAYLSVTPGTRIITGTERMQQRPIQVLVNALRELGADIEYVANDGFPITHHRAGIKKRHYQSARQRKFPIYFRFINDSPRFNKRTDHPVDRRYHLTPLHQPDFATDERFRCPCGMDRRPPAQVEPQAYHSTPFYVESDWSAASYWYQIVALSKEAEVTLPGLFKDSYQGDSQVAGIFRSLGVETIYKDKTVILKKNGKECGKAGLRLYQPTRPGTNICCDLCVTKYPFPLLRPAKFENQRNRPHGCTDNGNEETGVYTP